MKPYVAFLFLVFLLVQFTGCDNDENTNPEPVPQWERFQVFPYASLSSVEFYSNDFGVACGCWGAIFVTKNGGLTWETHKKGEACLANVFVLNDNTFFIGINSIYKFSNGGSSFTELAGEDVFGPSLTGIHFFDSDNGLVSTCGYIYKTTDGGRNWYYICDLGSAIRLQFVSDSIGYSYGGYTNDDFSYGELYKTENQGNSWQNLSERPEIADFEIITMYFLNKDTAYMTNCNRELYYTWNGGSTWTMRSDSVPTHLYDMVFVSENEGYGIGYYGILKTTNGGITWSWDYKHENADLISIAKTPDNKKLIAVGRGVIMIKKLRNLDTAS
ncbi:MAG TPA: YCF48-related protein [Bacteroidales bacterium]|nr:YCF48-related protein [Bacteroidales bacterium]